MNWQQDKKDSLEGKLTWIRDGLNKYKQELGGYRYYLVVKDDKGNQLECCPVTSQLDKYGNEQFPKLITTPKLQKLSIVLTSSEFREIVDRKVVVKGIRLIFEVRNRTEIFREIK